MKNQGNMENQGFWLPEHLLERKRNVAHLVDNLNLYNISDLENIAEPDKVDSFQRALYMAHIANVHRVKFNNRQVFGNSRDVLSNLYDGETRDHPLIYDLQEIALEGCEGQHVEYSRNNPQCLDTEVINSITDYMYELDSEQIRTISLFYGRARKGCSIQDAKEIFYDSFSTRIGGGPPVAQIPTPPYSESKNKSLLKKYFEKYEELEGNLNHLISSKRSRPIFSRPSITPTN